MALAGPAPLSCVRKHNFLILDSFRRIFGLENGKFDRAAFCILVPASRGHRGAFCILVRLREKITLNEPILDTETLQSPIFPELPTVNTEYFRVLLRILAGLEDFARTNSHSRPSQNPSSIA